MANYIAVSRSNYFRVKDNAKFEEWCAEYEIEWSTEDEHGEGAHVHDHAGHQR